MAALFRWLATVNVVGVIVLLLALIFPGAFALGVLPRFASSVEVRLVPLEAPPARSPAPAPAVRLEIPAEYRTADLTPRPWDDLPGGGARLRD